MNLFPLSVAVQSPDGVVVARMILDSPEAVEKHLPAMEGCFYIPDADEACKLIALFCDDWESLGKGYFHEDVEVREEAWVKCCKLLWDKDMKVLACRCMGSFIQHNTGPLTNGMNPFDIDKLLTLFNKVSPPSPVEAAKHYVETQRAFDAVMPECSTIVDDPEAVAVGVKKIAEKLGRIEVLRQKHTISDDGDEHFWITPREAAAIHDYIVHLSCPKV